jgi:MoaA/NifB/PqqE/SkfB family radical SAM enzyme
MIDYDKIAHVHLEISSRCNAACPDCPRNLRGFDIEGQDFVVHDMSIEEFRTIFSAEFLQQLKGFLINGNHGDFVTCRDALEIIEYICECNPALPIEISTNASGQPKIWSKLGSHPNVTVVFRIDGLKDTHHTYRQYTDFDLIMKNATNFIAAGGQARWAMIKFDHNEHQIEECRHLSKQLGFARFDLVDVGRNSMPVFDREGNFLRLIGNPENPMTDIKQMLFTREMGIKNQEQVKYRNVAPAKKIECQATGAQSIYVQSNGQVYPCCWTGQAPDTNLANHGDQIRGLYKNNNALSIGLEHAIEWFAALEKTWSIPTMSQGRPIICNENCGRELIAR